MTIAELLADVPVIEVWGPQTSPVSAVVYASDEAIPGACFVAIRGRRSDGYQFIPDALARGAALVVGGEPPPASFPADRVYARVGDPRRELGTLAAAFYNHPSAHMEVIGVTGTDGKTTTTNLIEALLAAGGQRTGLMSTVDFKINDKRWQNNSRFTTLEAPEIQRTLAQMAGAGVKAAVVETTSSGLFLHRVWGVQYDVAVVTNITSEHLEVHGTLENYRRAKAMLCEAIDPEREKDLPFAVPRICVLNADDASYEYLKSFCRAPVISYG